MVKKKRKFLGRPLVLALGLALAVPAVAYAGAMYQGNAGYRTFSDVSYIGRSGIQDQGNGWVDGCSWTKASRVVQEGALECYIRILDDVTHTELNWGWDYNRSAQPANTDIQVSTNYYRGSTAKSLGVYSEHRVRNPDTLEKVKFNTYVGKVY